MGFINEQCDITVCGELKHGKGNVAEEQTRKECMGHELVVLGDEYAGAGTIKAWADSGMKFMGVAKGTPATVDSARLKRQDWSFPIRRAGTVWRWLSLISA